MLSSKAQTASNPISSFLPPEMCTPDFAYKVLTIGEPLIFQSCVNDNRDNFKEWVNVICYQIAENSYKFYIEMCPANSQSSTQAPLQDFKNSEAFKKMLENFKQNLDSKPTNIQE